MKVLLVNKYFYLRGGAEASFFNTAELLERNNHDLSYFSMDHPFNMSHPDSKYFMTQVDFKDTRSLFRSIQTSTRILYSWEARRRIRKLIKKQRPDVVHIHNIHHQISPSILHELRKNNIPVVMTLHDYKMVCPIYTMTNRGRVCEQCKGKNYFSCALKRCCQESFLKSLLLSLEMYGHHVFLNIYRFVDVFISPSRFLIHKLSDMGFQPKIFHLPNLINVDDFVPAATWEDRAIIFSGRLSQEKGLHSLLSAVKGLEVECRLFGDGPLRGSLERKMRQENIDNVSFFGHLSRQELHDHIRKGMFVVLPSEWYENSPFSVVEAFALGKPVVGARIGGIPELIQDNVTGFLHNAGDVDNLRNKILKLISDSGRISSLGKNARRYVSTNFDPEKHYAQLIGLYRQAIKKHG